MCSILRDSPVFKPCRSVVDPSSYIENCKYDMCSDANRLFRDVYRCRAIATYARECAKKNVTINWMDNSDLSELKTACQNSNYGKCTGGAVYTEQAPTRNKTCRELSVKNHEKYANVYGYADEAIPGCACPEGQLYEDLGSGTLQCVPKSSCSCFDVSTNHFYAAGEQIKRACSTWY